MQHTSTIRTDRLLLRPPEPRDAATIAARINNRRIAANTSRIPWPYDLDDARAFIDYSLALGERESVFVITREESGPIGAIGFELAGRSGAAELGYWLAEEWWNCGYATEAARAVVAYAFSDRGHDRLQARCLIGNEASRRVLVAAGFRPAGIGFCRTIHAPRPVISHLFELSSREWFRLRPQTPALRHLA
jgi:RimJ/RimL family protein N-acetyltransferase